MKNGDIDKGRPSAELDLDSIPSGFALHYNDIIRVAYGGAYV